MSCEGDEGNSERFTPMIKEQWVDVISLAAAKTGVGLSGDEIDKAARAIVRLTRDARDGRFTTYGNAPDNTLGGRIMDPRNADMLITAPCWERRDSSARPPLLCVTARARYRRRHGGR